MKRLITLSFIMLLLLSGACNHKKDTHSNHQTYAAEKIYTCPMHAEIIRNQPGSCPICGMTLVKMEEKGGKSAQTGLSDLLKPTNEFVLSSIPVTDIQKRSVQMEMEALGNIAYDTRQVGSISARVSGRIEKLYVRYRYQKISKGQKIMEIYSPELMTAQQNLLFLLKNDSVNINFINAAKDKLLLLGMSPQQMGQIIKEGTPLLTISVYSNYSGHIHESANGDNMVKEAGAMRNNTGFTEELSLKEGMYIKKGQSVFIVYDPAQAWVILNIYGENQEQVKTGNIVKVVPETATDKFFKAPISFIEPFYRKESKTATARVYFNNSALKLPVGSQVRATVFGNTKEAWWLPKDAVLSLGMDKVVFKKVAGGFRVNKITTGISFKDQIQVISGLTKSDSVAVNAQYLMDSESFIKIKK